MTYSLSTCNFGSYKPHMGIPVRIARGYPRGWKAALPKIDALTPGADYLKADDATFNRRFYGQLDDYGITALRARFIEISVGEGVPDHFIPTDNNERLVLMCFENLSKASICHRRMFAAWWLNRTGEDIPELGPTRNRAQSLLV